MNKQQMLCGKTWLYRNSLSVFFIGIFLITLIAQGLTGWQHHNSELEDLGARTLSLPTYLRSGHFISATFENFESEFLQMALYVVLTISLRQIGSAESKKIEGDEEVDREPVASKDAPWPVRKGGWILQIYSHSLSITFCLLFLGSWWLHFYGSWQDHNVEQALMGKPTDSMYSYLGQANFWFETFRTGKVNFFL